MRRIGVITNISGEQITFMLDERIDLKELNRLSNGKNIVAELRFNDNRTITAEQRKKAYALLNDISRWSGYSLFEIKEIMKTKFAVKENIDLFSLSDCSVTTAREFISFLIEFCFEWDVSFKDKGLSLHDDINKFLWLCIVHRKCVICGLHADIHHAEHSVGMGRDRAKYDHSASLFMALCRKHHNQAHNIGQQTFDRLHHVSGIKLSPDQVKELGIK